MKIHIPKFKKLKLKIILSRFLNMKSVLVVVFGLFIAIMGILYFPKTRGASAAWFDDSYKYRKKVTISNAGTAQTDFQVGVTFDTATPIAAGKMQSDCDDIRITAENGELLPHWIEEGSTPCDNASTLIWVKIPSIPVSDTNIYVYYGNSSATIGADGNKVFPFFDDFNGGVLDGAKWSATGGYTAASGTLTITTGSVYTNSPVVSTAQGYMFEQRTKWLTTTGTYGGLQIADDQSTGGSNSESDQLVYLMVGTAANLAVTSWAADGTTDNYNISINGTEYTAVLDTYHVSGFSLDGSSISFFNNRSLTNSYNGTWTQSPYLWLGYFTGATAATANNKDSTTDWVLARKFAATAPTVGAAGTEETTPGPVAYWKFDEGANNTCSGGSNDACDSTQNKWDLDMSGGPPIWQTPDKCVSGSCLYFDGNGDFLANPNSPDLSTQYTMSVWVKSPNFATQMYVMEVEFGAPLMYVQSNRIFATLRNSANTAWVTYDSGKTVLRNNEWNYITVTYDTNDDLKIYHNGALLFSGTHPGNIGGWTSAANTWIGGRSTVWFNGYIDEPKIYQYARSADQIKQEYLSRGSVQGVSAQFGDDNAGEALSNGLVGHWKMDESTWVGANAVLDSSGNLNSGTAVGNAAITGSGKYGNAGSFDGSGDVVNLGSSASLNPTELTVSGWFNMTSLVNEWAVAKWQSGVCDSNSSSYILAPYYSTTALPTFFICDGTTSTTAVATTTPTTGTWYHMVGTFKSGEVRIYVNGALEGTTSTSITSTNQGATDTVLLGGHSGSSGIYSGSMDDVRIYNRALSPREVSQLYNFAPPPVHYYDFEQNTGTTSVVDKSGNDNTGTMRGSMTENDWVPGKYGSGLEFDNTDDYVSAGTGPTTPITGDQVTMTAWIKPNNLTSNDAIIAKGKSGVMSYMLMRLGSNVYMEVNTGTNSTLQGTKTLVTNKWQHVAAVYDGANKLLYVDGVLDNSGALTGNILGNTGPFSFAKRDGQNEWFGGALDEVKVYNYARTQKQIIQDMNAGHPSVGSPVGSPVVYLKMDEGYGTTANDSSVQGNNGTLSAGASQPSWTNNGKFGKALSFDGGDGVLLASTDSLTFTTASNYTVSSWFKTSSSATQQIFSQQRCNNGTIQLYMSSGNISWRIVDIASNALIITSPKTYNDDTWHHVLGVRDTGEDKIILYVDGVRVVDGIDPSVTDITPATTENWIGKRYPCALTDNFTGLIDEFKIYNGALSGDEVKVEYNHGKAMVLGAGSSGIGNTSADSAGREYCPPGDTVSCKAPEAEWLMDENTGTTTTYDTSDNENNGTLRDSPSWSPGIKSSALQFDGTDDYVEIGDITTFDGSTEMTMSAWIKPNTVPVSTDMNSIVSKANYVSAAENAYFIRLRGTEGVRAQISDGTNLINCDTHVMPSINVWTHIVATFNTSDTCTVYYNAIGVGSSVNSSFTSITNNTRSLKIAASDHASEQYYDGLIDQVRIYDYARTPAQIAWEYNKGAPIAHYKFDECEGTTAYNSLRTVNGSPAGLNGSISAGNTAGSNDSAGTCSSGAGDEMWANGAVGKRNASLDFDGTNDYVIVPNTNSIFSLTQPSISAWIKTSSTAPANYIIYKNRNGVSADNDDNYTLRTASGLAVFTMENAADGTDYTTVSSKNVADGNWHHLLGLYDGTDLKLYVDGKLEDTTNSGAFSPYQGTGSLQLGSNSISNHGVIGYFDGQIDEVKIFNYPLTAEQARIEHNAGAVRFE